MQEKNGVTCVAVQSLSCVQLFTTPWTAACQASLSFSIPRVCSNSCPLSQWCHPTISFSAVPFSSCPQPSRASGSFPMSWVFASGGQWIGVSTSASVLPINIQGWFPLGLTGLISLQAKGPSRVFSSITVWKHRLCGAQPSLWGHMDEASFNLTDVFIRRDEDADTQRAATRPGRGQTSTHRESTLRRSHPADTLILDFQPLELWGKKYL